MNDINNLKSALAKVTALAETNDHPVVQTFAKIAQLAVSFTENCAAREDAGETLDDDDFALLDEFQCLIKAFAIFIAAYKRVAA